jgi:hypothetical protein
VIEPPAEDFLRECQKKHLNKKKFQKENHAENRAKKRVGSKAKKKTRTAKRKLKSFAFNGNKKSRKKRKRGLSLKRQLPKFLLQKKKRNKFFIHCLFTSNFLLEKCSALKAETLFFFSKRLHEIFKPLFTTLDMPR